MVKAAPVPPVPLVPMPLVASPALAAVFFVTRAAAVVTRSTSLIAVPAVFEVGIAPRFIFLLTLESVPGCILYTERIGTSRKSVAIRRSRQTGRGEHGHAPTL